MQSIASTPPGRWILIWSLWKVWCLIKTGLTYKNRTDLLKHNSPLTNVSKQRFLSRRKQQLTQGRTTPAFRTGQSSVSYSWILSAVMPLPSPPWTVSKIIQFRAHSYWKNRVLWQLLFVFLSASHLMSKDTETSETEAASCSSQLNRRG